MQEQAGGREEAGRGWWVGGLRKDNDGGGGGEKAASEACGGGGVRGREGGGMFAWGGQRVLGVDVKSLGRHQVSVPRAWCSALCTAGLSHSVLWQKGRAGVGEKGILAGNLVGVCTRRGRGKDTG